MGMFKQMKDMKAMVAAAPDMIAQGNQMASQAYAMAEASQYQHQAAVAAQHEAALAAPVSAEGDFAPIAGVTLELYAEISRSLAEVAYDTARAPEMAARKGVSAPDWDAAVAGWNARMHSNPAVGQRFNALYVGR